MRWANRILALSFGLNVLIPCEGQLYINEFQVSNINTIIDPGGNFLQWIEIYNDGDQWINLNGYALTDDLNDPFRGTIGSLSIGPKATRLIWLDPDGGTGYSHIKLDMDGEQIGLFNPAGQLLDSVSFSHQYLDISLGREPDGSGAWYFFPEPTPGAINSTEAYAEALFSGNAHFTLKGGFYSGSQLVELSSSSHSGRIHYTVDGSWPTESAHLSQSPIVIDGTTVIRARVFEDGKMPGNVVTQTYILNDSTSLPVVSISTDADHFFSDYSGIYVEGTNGILGMCSDIPVNWNRDWERPVNFEYFTPDGIQQVNQLTGTKIAGDCSRTSPFKSLAIFARKKYGDNSLRHRFFDSKDIEEYKTLMLRNSGNDHRRTLFRDGFMQSLLSGQMDIDLQSYQPALIYLNGEYWGILNVREKINEHYPASNYNLDPDQVDILEKEYYLTNGIAMHGDGEHYKEMFEYAMNNDLSVQAHFDHVASRMDMDEFLYYYVAEIYFENVDWPQNNIKYWRPHVEGGKWRWVMFDTDYGWGMYDGINYIISNTITKDASYTRLIRALIENEGFKNELLQRMAAAINTVFDPGRVHHIYDSIRNKVDQEIDRHIDRWGTPGSWRYNDQTNVVLPEFTNTRPDEMRTIVLNSFDISGMYTLSADVNDSARGWIQASGMALPSVFSGTFFNDVPLRLMAVPRSGYAFSHWEGASSAEQETIFLDLSADAVIRAVFEPVSPAGNLVINEICASNLNGIKDNYGQTEDWIEIYNLNDFPVDLAGWYLSDSAGHETKYRIPDGYPELTTVQANDFLIIWCDNNIRQGPLHANFRLKQEGEFISLIQQVDQDYHVVDTISYPALGAELSYGRVPGTDRIELMSPTPLAANLSNSKTEILINEYQSKNPGKILDEYGEADDWIELYNPSPDTVELGGLYLTDSLQHPIKHMIPTGNSSTRLLPFGFLVLWADGQPDQGPLHLGFKLDSRSEEIGIYQLGIGFLDSLTYQQEPDGMVRGRYPDGSENLQVLKGSPGDTNMVYAFKNLYINEFMASNRSIVQDEYGEFEDWIEIYNDNDYPVDIGGILVTDTLGDPLRFRIPVYNPDSTTIPPKGFLVLWADDQEEQGILHLNFRLNADGEQIGILQPDGSSFIDSLSYSSVHSNQAFGLLEDGSDHLQIVNPSPGTSNYLQTTAKLYISEIVASDNDLNPDNWGEYDDWIEIYNDNEFDVNIGGLYITDTIGDLTKYYIPSDYPDLTTIKPKDYLVLWADNQTEQGVNHLGFKLKGDGEQLALVDLDGSRVIDSLNFPGQYRSFSYSRLNNTGEWRFLPPTHNAFNMLPVVSGILINEFMASNTCITDEYGEYDDWIELYNSNNYDVQIGGLYLTDSLGYNNKYRIPSHSPERTIIPAAGYYLIYADDQSDQGVNHANFKLSREGEQIALVHYDETTILDSLSYPKQYKNSSFSRIQVKGSWYSIPPTPLRPNKVPDFSDLAINEIMGFNKTYLSDEFNEFDDWIELYNGGPDTLDIGGMYLTDSLIDPVKFRLSSEFPDFTTIPPNGFILLWADNTEEQGILHLGFKISKTGERIGLFNHLGEPIDTITYPFIRPNYSWGRIVDGEADWIHFQQPTPLMSNLRTSSEADVEYLQDHGINPNPVRDRAQFIITHYEAATFRTEILDLQGKVRAILMHPHDGSGMLRYDWDVTDATGRKLNNGFYIYRMVYGDSVRIGKFLVQD